MEAALNALDDDMLTSLAAQNSAQAGEVLQFRQQAREVFSELTVAIVAQNGTPAALTFNDQMRTAFTQLDALASNPERKEWLAKELNHADNVDHQQLLSAVRGQAVESPVLKAAIEEMQVRTVAVVAENIRKEVIFPSLYRAGQPDSNVALLRRAEHSLARATTAAQVNQALDDIIDHYGARNKPWSKPLSSTTIEMAKAWRIAE